jgi:hypothetical protein
VSDTRWTFFGTSPSVAWLLDLPPEMLESQHLKLSKPPKASLVFAAGTTEEVVRGVVEQAVADGVYDITVTQVDWPPVPADETVHYYEPDSGDGP